MICQSSDGVSIMSQAHLLNGYDMAIGKWTLKMTRRDRWAILDEILFPPVQNQGGEEEGVVTVGRARKRKSTLSCSLALEPDGTFVLSPLPGDLPDRLPIRGEWFLKSNPYCVTDRQYDELYLVSYPRVKQIQSFDRQYAVFELRCRLWGRYGMKTIRDAVGYNHGRTMGRLTHGTMLLVRREHYGDIDLSDTQFHVPRWRRKVICGRFRAKPIGEAASLPDYEDFDHGEEQGCYDEEGDNESEDEQEDVDFQYIL
jgi:hypothetical protein